MSITEFIGRFHPVLVHLPIGVLLLALLLQWLSINPRYALNHAVIKVIWWIGVGGALLSCVTGYLLSLTADYEEDLVDIHMWLGISVAVFSTFVANRIFVRRFNVFSKAISFLLFLIVVITGHFGGVLTHGSDYLSAGLFEEEEQDVTRKPIANVQEAVAYTDVIQPLLEAKCYGCHSARKQKGKLRLDSPEWINKGGKNGDVIVSGDPDGSELVKRLLLPPEDEHHMPPRQKPQLRESEIELIHWWIGNGSSYDKKVGEINQPDKIKPVLASLEAKNSKERKLMRLMPEEPVEAASEKVLQALKAKGVIVMPVAAGSNYLTANFITAASFSDKDMQLLAPLKKQLVNLKAGNTKLGDEAMKTIATFNNMMFLQLNNTGITDAGVAYLQALKELQSLNLVNTAVSYQGLANLKQLKNLRHIYVYNTKITSAHYSVLKKQFPEAVIDTGGYRLPALASDTVYVTKPLSQ
jgi:hypothetical protein